MALLASRKKSSLMGYRSLYENLYSYRVHMTTNDQPHRSTKVPRFLSTSLSEQLLVPSSLLRHIVLCRIAYRNSSRPFNDQIEELRTVLLTIEAQQHPECTATLLRTMMSLLELKKIDQEIKSRSRRVVRSPCLLPELHQQEIQLRSTINGCLREHAKKPWHPKKVLVASGP